MTNSKQNVIKFSRLLYKENYDFFMELEVNGELELWYYVDSNYGKMDYNDITKIIADKLSDHCILQEQEDLSLLFYNSKITHFDIDLPNVKYADYMFCECKDLVHFKSKMPNVEYFEDMFSGCSEEFLKNHQELIKSICLTKK